LKSFNYRKEAWAMQKLFIKEKEKVLKIDNCLRYENNGYSDARHKKRKKEKQDELYSP
jgi:hypothetical protein